MFTTSVLDIAVDVEPKDIKHIHLSVFPPNARVHLSMPAHLSKEDADAFILSKYTWIQGKREEVLAQERQPIRQYRSGENHYLFGKCYQLMVKDSNVNSASVKLTFSKIIMNVRPASTVEKRAEILWNWYRALLKEKIEQYVNVWLERMQEIKPITWQVKHLKTEWGSCVTQKRSILFNLELARVPLECIEYVVVHELVHLKVENHGKLFEAQMSHYLPNWRELRKQLNDFIALPI